MPKGDSEFVDVQAVFAGKVFDGHPTQCPKGAGRNPKLDEATLRFAPDALGLQIGKLTFLGLDVRVRDLVAYIRAFSGQWADASHVGLRS